MQTALPSKDERASRGTTLILRPMGRGADSTALTGLPGRRHGPRRPSLLLTLVGLAAQGRPLWEPGGSYSSAVTANCLFSCGGILPRRQGRGKADPGAPG